MGQLKKAIKIFVEGDAISPEYGEMYLDDFAHAREFLNWIQKNRGILIRDHLDEVKFALGLDKGWNVYALRNSQVIDMLLDKQRRLGMDVVSSVIIDGVSSSIDKRPPIPTHVFLHKDVRDLDEFFALLRKMGEWKVKQEGFEGDSNTFDPYDVKYWTRVRGIVGQKIINYGYRFDVHRELDEAQKRLGVKIADFDGLRPGDLPVKHGFSEEDFDQRLTLLARLREFEKDSKLDDPNNVLQPSTYVQSLIEGGAVSPDPTSTSFAAAVNAGERWMELIGPSRTVDLHDPRFAPDLESILGFTPNREQIIGRSLYPGAVVRSLVKAQDGHDFPLIANVSPECNKNVVMHYQVLDEDDFANRMRALASRVRLHRAMLDNGMPGLVREDSVSLHVSVSGGVATRSEERDEDGNAVLTVDEDGEKAMNKRSTIRRIVPDDLTRKIESTLAIGKSTSLGTSLSPSDTYLLQHLTDELDGAAEEALRLERIDPSNVAEENPVFLEVCNQAYRACDMIFDRAVQPLQDALDSSVVVMRQKFADDLTGK